MRLVPIFLLFSLFVAEARAGDLDDARRLAVQGRHAEARGTARQVLLSRPNDPEALQIIVVASCELGDRQSASWALNRLASDVQATAGRHCARRGIIFGVSTPPPAAPPSDPRRPWRIASWITLATTAASVITLTAMGLHVANLEEEKEELIAARRLETRTIYSSDDVCDEAEARGDRAMIDICRSGHRATLTTNIMLGVGLVTAALSGYFYYRGYIKREQPTTRISVGPGGAAFSVSF
jgi:hypothetical protein